MGQLLSMAVPLTDPVATHRDAKEDDHDEEPSDDAYNQQLEHVNGTCISCPIGRRKKSTKNNQSAVHTPRELANTVSAKDDMSFRGGFSFNDSISSGNLPSIARARIVKRMLDTFETYEFLVDTAVSGVLSYNLGYEGDAHQQIGSLHRKIASNPQKYPPTLSLEFEEEYHRGLLTNAFFTCDSIIRMAAFEITPSLVELRRMDRREVRMFLQEHAGVFVDMKELEPKRPAKKYVTTYVSSTTLISNHRRTASAAMGSQSPQRSIADFSAFEAAETPQASPTTSAFPPSDPTVLALFKTISGAGIDAFKTKCDCQITDSWMFLKEPGCAQRLSSGNGYFKFMSRALSECNTEDLDAIQPFVNVSSFRDEVVENNAPHVDVYNPEHQALYIALVVKAMYILPGVRFTDLTADLMSDLNYQKHCQPGDCKFFECEEPNTFRQNKTIIKFVYTIVIQLKAGMITDPEELKKFNTVEGITPCRAILLERTKRNVQKTDSTAKCKSVLLYYQLDGGVLLSHTTVVLNRSVPTIVAKVVNNFGGQGAKEAAETADLTRRFLLKTFGDSRSNSN